jgi:CheY-like chemotaxis protein
MSAEGLFVKTALRSVAIVDDNADSRESFSYTVEDAQLRPVLAEGPLGSLDAFTPHLESADVLLSDYELRAKNYAKFTGAELVAQRQRHGQPAILCTKYEKPQVERIRPHRRWIPVLLAPDDLDPDSLLTAIETCAGEIAGRFSPERRPYRALVRFVEPDPESPGRFFVELPSWQPSILVPIHLSDLPADVAAAAIPDYRCHAIVNLGSERYEDVYFDGWVAS